MMLFDLLPVCLSLFDGEGGAQGDTTASSANTQPDNSGALVNGQQDGQLDAGAEKVKDVEVTSNTLEERRKAFRDLVNGEYKDIYTQETQRIINRRFKEAQANEQRWQAYQPVLDTLMERYNITDGDAEKLMEAVDNDHAYWSEAAEAEGLTEEQYKEVRRLRRENAELIRAEEQRQQAAFNRAKAEEWAQQAEAMKANPVFKDFDLMRELDNPEFLSLLRAGTPMEHAYKVLHFDELMTGAVQNAAAATEKKVADNIRAKGNRPDENGTKNNSAFTVKADPSKLTKKECEELERRAARGERVTFPLRV